MKTTDEQTEAPDPAASRGARAMNRARWKNKTPEERKAFMAPVRESRAPEQMGAAIRRKPRCPCGAMTRDRAKQRNHKCGKK